MPWTCRVETGKVTAHIGGIGGRRIEIVSCRARRTGRGPPELGHP